MVRSIAVVLAAAIAAGLSGCYKEWGREALEPTVEHGDPAIADVTFGGQARVRDDGKIELALAMTASCTVTSRTIEKTLVKKRRSDVPWILHLTIGGTIAYVGALVGGIGVVTTYPDTGEKLLLIGAVGAVDALGNLIFVRRTKTSTETHRGPPTDAPADCPPALVDDARDRTPRQVTITTPWGAQLTANVAQRVAVFDVDWSKAAIDPLDPGAADSLRQPWTFAPDRGAGAVDWRPDPASVELALGAIGRATGTEVTAHAGEAPPLLDVGGLTSDGPLVAGRPAHLTFALTNHGRGGAYRVVAVTKSSDPALHGLRFSFGKIAPGATVNRTIDVTVPRDHDDGDALVVVEVAEANGNNPDRYSTGLTITHASRPRIDVACKLTQGAKDVTADSLIDAGRQLRLRCTITNHGDGAARAAAVEASLAHGAPRGSTTVDVAAGAKAALDVLLQVPADGKTGQILALDVTARETSFGATAQWTAKLEIGLMQICKPPITRPEYERKLTEIRGLGYDAETLKAYEEQLVACLGT